MLLSGSDERAAMVFDDLASALEAGLPLDALGGQANAGDEVLSGVASSRGVHLSPAESLALTHGWRAGRGVESLRNRANSRRQRAAFKQTLWTQLRYPLLLLVMILVASIATSFVIGPWIAIGLGCAYVALAALAWFVWHELQRGGRRIDSWPIVGRLVADFRELPYLETLHALYSSGVAIVAAHRAAVDTVQLRGLRDQLERAHQQLVGGETLRESLAQANALSSESRVLLANGEQAGQLEDALARALRRRQQTATQTLQFVTRSASIAIYAAAAIGVGLIVIQFYTSLFSLYRGVGR